MNLKKTVRASSAALCTLALMATASWGQSTIIEVQGAPTYASTVACPGDVNGDGINDLAVGDDIVGSVEILSGIDGSLIRQLNIPANGQTWGNQPSYCIDTLGDLNGDGNDDFMVSKVGDTISGLAGSIPIGPGIVGVFSGQTGNSLYVIPAISGEQSFGYAAISVDDLDQDGKRDIVVGAPGASTQGKQENGYVAVYSGATGTLLYLIHGAGNGHRFGQSLADTHDLDGDNKGDFVVGSNRAAGTAFIISGNNGSLIRSHQAGSPTLSNSFGLGYPDIEVAGGADVNGDGTNDVVLAKRGDQTNGPNAGAIFIYSGLNGQMIGMILGGPCDGIGAKIDLADVNNDGMADILSSSRNDAGHDDDVTVYSGATNNPTFDTDGVSNDMTQISLVGDVDGDGTKDFFVGTDPSGSNPGRAIVVAGGPWMGVAGTGVVTNAQGEIQPLLTINGDDGGIARRIDLKVGDPVVFDMAQPAANGTPAAFAIFGQFGSPGETDTVNLPGGIGDFAIVPVPMAPWAQPTLFTLASSLGPVAGGEILPATPSPWTHNVAGGINFPVTFTLQGVVENSPGVLKSTNGIIVRVR